MGISKLTCVGVGAVVLAFGEGVGVGVARADFSYVGSHSFGGYALDGNALLNSDVQNPTIPGVLSFAPSPLSVSASITSPGGGTVALVNTVGTYDVDLRPNGLSGTSALTSTGVFNGVAGEPGSSYRAVGLSSLLLTFTAATDGYYDISLTAGGASGVDDDGLVSYVQLTNIPGDSFLRAFSDDPGGQMTVTRSALLIPAGVEILLSAVGRTEVGPGGISEQTDGVMSVNWAFSITAVPAPGAAAALALGAVVLGRRRR